MKETEQSGEFSVKITSENTAVSVTLKLQIKVSFSWCNRLLEAYYKLQILLFNLEDLLPATCINSPVHSTLSLLSLL